MLDLRDRKTRRTLLVLLGLAVVGYVFFLSNWLPWGYRAHAGEIRQLEERYQKLAREVTQAQQAARRLNLLKQEHDELTGTWEAAKGLLPEEREIVSLLREITIAGQSAGVEFVHVVSRQPVPRPYVTEHPFEVKVMGGFHQMGSFLGEVSGMDRLVSMKLVEITGKDDPEEGITLDATFLASAYTLGGLDPAAQVAEAKGLKGSVERVRQQLSGQRERQPPGRSSEE